MQCVSEAFVVCQNYSPPEGYIPNMFNPLLDNHSGTLLFYKYCYDDVTQTAEENSNICVCFFRKSLFRILFEIGRKTHGYAEVLTGVILLMAPNCCLLCDFTLKETPRIQRIVEVRTS